MPAIRKSKAAPLFVDHHQQRGGGGGSGGGGLPSSSSFSRILSLTLAFAAGMLVTNLSRTSHIEEELKLIARRMCDGTTPDTLVNVLPAPPAAIPNGNSNPDTSITNSNSCPLKHTSKLSVPTMVISKSAVQVTSKDGLDHIKRFTIPQYQVFMMENPGMEHYTLWHYLTKTFHAGTTVDCRHIVDIGTRYAASALALGVTGIPVKSFDIEKSTERRLAFQGKTEAAWQHDLQTNSKVQLEFKNLDLLTISDADFAEYMSTWLIIVDTFHLPYTVPFEREWLDRIVTMKPRFEGIVMLDDIHLNDEMSRWWTEVKDNASVWGFIAHDVTAVGHATGTGLLDFSGGKVSIVD